LFDPKNTLEFTNKLKKFIDNDSLRNKIGKEQHKESIKYDTKLIVDKLIDHYKND
jgi:glycosyltransferase involved in cell wall biosynthesis